MIIAMLNCERFLLLIKQDARAAAYAQIYSYFLIPSMIFHSQFDATRQFLNSIHKSAVVTITMVTTSMLHVFWCYVFVVVSKLDIIGIGIATLTSYTFNFVMITILCKSMSDLEDSFFFFGPESF